MEIKNYLAINKASWNNRLKAHLESDFYGVEHFLQGKSSLNSIELDLLGDLKGKRVLHLQCHFGQDTLSLGRLGAEVTGVDFSDKAIVAARDLALRTGINAHFICADIYDLPNHLNAEFDLVFSSYGTIGWLPDLDKWATVVSKFLKPGGKFVFAEFHPVVWMFDNDFETVYYPYFKGDPILESETGSYADKTADLTLHSMTWNHGLAEVFTALGNQKIGVELFREYDYSPYNCFNGMEAFEPGKFRIRKFGNKIPMVYALVGRKQAL